MFLCQTTPSRVCFSHLFTSHPPSPQVQKAPEPQDASQGLEEAVVPRQHADTPFKRTKRSWVLPPINVAENMQGPFPKDILTVRPPHLHATHAHTGTHLGMRVRPQKRHEKPVQIALTHTRVPQANEPGPYFCLQQYASHSQHSPKGIARLSSSLHPPTPPY